MNLRRSLPLRLAAVLAAAAIAAWPGLALAQTAVTRVASVQAVPPGGGLLPPGTSQAAPQSTSIRLPSDARLRALCFKCPRPTPTITSISPTYGDRGTTVILKGSGFTGAGFSGVTQVAFGGTIVSAEATSDSTLETTAPSGPPGGSVQVGIPGTTAVAPQPFTFPFASLQVTGLMPTISCICPDPWPQFHQIEAPATLYPQGRGYPQNAPHATIEVATPTPTFYVDAEADSSGQPYGPSGPWDGEAPVFWKGNVANFAAALEFCAVPPPGSPAPANPDCTDFAGKQGNWQPVQGATDSWSVACGGAAAIPLVHTLAVQDSNPLDIAGFNIERTYRLKLEVYLSQTPGVGAFVTDDYPGGPLYTSDDTEYTAPIDVVLAPSAVYQVDVLPYTIVYAPPGDQSSATYTIASSYGTTISVGSSASQSNSFTSEQDSSIRASLQYGFQIQPLGVKVGGGYSIAGTQNWDNSTSYGFGRTATSKQEQGTAESFSTTLPGPGIVVGQVPGDGKVCAVKNGPQGYPVPDCSQVSQAGSYWTEPFWHDRFFLLVHPQFAAWSYGGQEDDALLGAVPGLYSIDVYHLELCAAGALEDPSGAPPCQITYVAVDTGGGTFTSANASVPLSAGEAQNLLQLDPFYAGGGQSAALDDSRFSPTADVPAQDYGAYVGSDLTPPGPPSVPKAVVTTFSLKDTNVQSTGGSTTFTADVTDTIGSQESVGGQLDLAGSGAGITYTTGESQKTQQQVQVTFSNSTATSQVNAVSTQATVQDADSIDVNTPSYCPKFCHAPLLHQLTVAVYLDNMFGGFAFVDPAAPKAPLIYKAVDNIANIFNVLRQEIAQGTGSGSASGTGSGSASGQSQSSGQGAGSGTGSGSASGQSQSSGQGAGSGTGSSPGQGQGSGGRQGPGQQTPGGAGQFSDVPASYWAASAIQTLVAKGIAGGFPDGTFQPDATLTRAQFVKLLVLTLGLKTAGGGATPFTDVTSSDWFAPYVSAAVRAGLAQGVSPTSFDPGGTVTREQMAVLLTRALKLGGQAALRFTDASAVDGWAAQGVRAAVSAGYLAGFPDGSFQPRGATTRAQAAKVLALALSTGAAPGPDTSGSP